MSSDDDYSKDCGCTGSSRNIFSTIDEGPCEVKTFLFAEGR